MFGSVVLDIAIGLFFIYLLLSLICSAVRESIEGRLKSRAIHLERGIRELLRDSESIHLAKKVYEHPLIYSLYPGDYDASRTVDAFRGLRWITQVIWSWMPATKPTNLPSYIPARNFALAVLDLAGRGETYKHDQQPAQTTIGTLDERLTVSHIRASLRNLDNPYVERAILTALDTAGDDVESAIENVQKWYDSAMDRVSGWYKRETQRILFMLGLIITVALNVDTISIVQHLAISKDAREALVQQVTTSLQDDSSLRERVEAERSRAAVTAGKTGNAAETESSAVPSTSSTPSSHESSAELELQAKIKTADAKAKLLKEQLFGLGLPLGWSEMRKGAAKRVRCTATDISWFDEIGCALWPYDVWLIFAAIPGWLITAFAISFGAPFWFDMLNKMMVIRSTVKPHEKSPEERSNDRQQPSVSPRQASPPAPHGTTQDAGSG